MARVVKSVKASAGEWAEIDAAAAAAGLDRTAFVVGAALARARGGRGSVGAWVDGRVLPRGPVSSFAAKAAVRPIPKGGS